MKNLTKRNKIVLGIVGIVVVVAVIGLVIMQTPASELFGTLVGYPYISPANPTINVGATVTLNMVNKPGGTAPNCTWSVPLNRVVSLSNATASSVVVKGNSAGTVTITATCNIGTRSTSVTVK